MIVILPDVHLSDNQSHTDYEVVKRFIKKNKSDEIILLGDFMDVLSLSAWDLSKRRKMEGRRYEKECEVIFSPTDAILVSTLFAAS